MQDAANKGQDSGRCPVCGKVYQWKLLNHVAEDHVYTAHSGVAKKGDKSKQQAASKTSGSVLKTPVKLSDEISIIPTKKDKSKEVIDLDDEEEIDDVEKEVIDIDTPKKRKADEQPQAKKAKV